MTLRRNRDVFERIAWLPRALVGAGAAGHRHRGVRRTVNMPIVDRARQASTACSGRRAIIALARAAAAAGIPFTLSTASNCAVGRLASTVPGQITGISSMPTRTRASVDRLIDRVARRPAAKRWSSRPTRRCSARASGTSAITGADEAQRDEHARRARAPALAHAGHASVRRAEFENLVEFLPPGKSLGPDRREVQFLADQLVACRGATSSASASAGRASWS